jgi:hypothetical protein
MEKWQGNDFTQKYEGDFVDGKITRKGLIMWPYYPSYTLGVGPILFP